MEKPKDKSQAILLQSGGIFLKQLSQTKSEENNNNDILALSANTAIEFLTVKAALVENFS